ncbi:MAG TPA: 50S ribosomal protein L28 [Rhodospirillaceae bacterium]|nr:50S ribosomal protein L28 [Rhodospirillaceae bacterium]
MSRECAVTEKKPMSGHNVSHANNKTKRRFDVNLQNVSLYSEKLKRSISLRVTNHGLRTIEHNGGIDAYVLSTPASKLSLIMRDLKKKLKSA